MLFMIGAFTDRMAGVLWVILALSIVTVSNRIHYTYLVLNKSRCRRLFARFFFWRDDGHAALRHLGGRDSRVRLAVPPDWISDPTATGMGLLAYLR